MKRAKQSIAILFTLLFTISVFAVTAFANSSIPASSAVSSTPSSSDGGTGGSGEPSKDSEKPVTSTPPKTTTSTKSSTTSKKPTTSVDTHTSKINAAASKAAGVTSDPDVLSSQNWNELLSGLNSTDGGTVSLVSSQVSSAAASSDGGISWMLIVGIIFVLLGVGGIGFFIYNQFIAKKNGPRGPHTPSGGSGIIEETADNSATMEFEDISSSSDGLQHREDYVPPVANPMDGIRPAGTINRAPAPQRRPAVPTQGMEAKPSAQATPVENGKDFDWEAFFNENK